LHYPTKRAATQWYEWQEKRPSWSTVYRAFNHKFYRNLGILCGKASGKLVVLDFDRPLHYYQWRDGRKVNTYTVRTGRGFHVYYRLEDPPKGTCSMKGGEVKASGYVVAPPSTHPSGSRYREVGSSRAVLSAVNLDALGIDAEFQENPNLPTWREPRVELDRRLRDRKAKGSLSDRIKAVLPITRVLSQYTELRPSGNGWYVCRCPFHDDRNPSMWVNPASGYCRCFKPGCRGRGDRPMDVINLYGRLKGLRNGEAVRELARKLGV
jgi:hypothetical protein